jgi:uncharacterized protein
MASMDGRVKGQVIGGGFGKILIRQKAGEEIEIGELLVSDEGQKIILQAYDIVYGSQIPQSSLELMSGIRLEEDSNLGIFDYELRNYNLVFLKNLLSLKDNNNTAGICKTIPKFFSTVREIKKDDLNFLTKPDNPLFLGHLRSGSKVLLDQGIFLQGDKVLAEHILIPATTGRGKSNLTACMLWDCIDKDYCGILVLDPHDEYYGRNGLGLKDHPVKNVVYYTPKSPPPGCKTLKLSIDDIKPQHFNGVVNWSDAQGEALYSYYKKFGEEWISALFREEKVDGFQEGTIAVVKRRLQSILNIQADGNGIICRGVFDVSAGKTTIKDICAELESGKIVVIDTSSFSGPTEILIGSMISSEIFSRYKRYKTDGQLKDKPVISIVLEEAPRVLGKDVLEKGSNIFSTLAREGRKFKIGLIAITQLPSLIPRQILANMNTKIILGIEMAPERQAVIESASQDLSDYGRNIASLDKGEAIITSHFARFAIPVKIPSFEDLAAATKNEFVRKKYLKKDLLGIETDG